MGGVLVDCEGWEKGMGDRVAMGLEQGWSNRPLIEPIGFGQGETIGAGGGAALGLEGSFSEVGVAVIV